jgi:23S rRNA (adenine2030-N6)-methyltransferase
VLSYRHGFHAGNFADVLKHTVLIAILDYLNQKEAPYCYIDTHSGAGMYALNHRFMQKNQEYQTGIGKLWGKTFGDPALDRYLKVIGSFNDEKLSVYPGSPKIAQALYRDHDRLQLVELHPSDVEELDEHFFRVPRTKVFKLDASDALVSFLPPKEKRGLIFIDPPYELDSEYTSLVQLLKLAEQKFPSGTYALWYPVIERRKIELFIRKISALSFKSGLRIEHCLHADGFNQGMTGSGLLVLNGPFNLQETLTPTLKKLKEHLGNHQGFYRIEPLLMGPKSPSTPLKNSRPFTE